MLRIIESKRAPRGWPNEGKVEFRSLYLRFLLSSFSFSLMGFLMISTSSCFLSLLGIVTIKILC